MQIQKVVIRNFKLIKDLTINFNSGVNIIVGNNEAGKSTILEAIHLALSGMLNGKHIKNELSQYLFNKDVEKEYIDSLKTENAKPLPDILIEIFFEGDNLPIFEGDANSTKNSACGISLKIEFDEELIEEYNCIDKTKLCTIPIELYKIKTTTFARDVITARRMPIKSVLIDSSSNRFQNGSDIYISKIIKDHLNEADITGLSQAYRELKEGFMLNDAVEVINGKITDGSKITDKKIFISVDMSVKNSWENQLMTYLDEIPFHQIGKGEQCIIKTNLALSHKKALESNLILIEEPENHLSFSKLNQFVTNLSERCEGKQIIITTHSSFIANKLKLNNLILLNDLTTFHLKDLDSSTYEYFEKLAGYETLRVILCKKSILVEGPSDELIVQKAYRDKYNKLPIENGIDIISVKGLSFKRFLNIAKLLNKKVAIITDNDGDYEHKIIEKYRGYSDLPTIKIFADHRNELNTLEPQLVDANSEDLKNLLTILGVSKEQYPTLELLYKYMISQKTTSALKIFNSDIKIKYPIYISSVIDWCHE